MSDDRRENGRKSLGENVELSQVMLDLASSYRGMASNFVGICVIILTFILGLMLQSGNLNNVLFQAVLALIVVDISFFGFSNFYYALSQSSIISGDEGQKEADLKKARTTYLLGVILLWLDAPLLTLALGIYWVALLGFALVCTYLVATVYERGKHKMLRPSEGLRYLQNPERPKGPS